MIEYKIEKSCKFFVVGFEDYTGYFHPVAYERSLEDAKKRKTFLEENRRIPSHLAATINLDRKQSERKRA